MNNLSTCAGAQARPPTNSSSCSWPLPITTNLTNSTTTLSTCCQSNILSFNETNGSGCPLQYCELSTTINNITVSQCLAAALNESVECYGAVAGDEKGNARRGAVSNVFLALMVVVVGGWTAGLGGV